MTEDDLARLVRGDDWMMRVLRAADMVALPDLWIGAGFLRNAVWDWLSGREPRNDADVDLVYFDAADTTAQRDWDLDADLRQRFPFARWEVRNQARMHERDGLPPYSSTEDGIAHWVETATCVGVRLTCGQLEFVFCHDSEDLFGLTARPIPEFRNSERIEVFRRRVDTKGWRQRWPNLRVEEA
ncbi:MAG: nucleotidyltransferase family protein [Ancrocorticia sp.]